MMPQDSQGNGTSEPQQNQDQDIEYEIIIAHNEPRMEPNVPLVESDETEQNENNPFEALDDMDNADENEDIVPEYKMTGTRRRCPPSQYQPDLRSNKYDDTSEQIHIQVNDVTKIKLPKVRQCDKFNHVIMQ